MLLTRGRNPCGAIRNESITQSKTFSALSFSYGCTAAAFAAFCCSSTSNRLSCATAGNAVTSSAAATMRAATINGVRRMSVLFGVQQRSRRQELLLLCFADRRVLQVELLQRRVDDRPHGETGEPLVVGGNDVPG